MVPSQFVREVTSQHAPQQQVATYQHYIKKKKPDGAVRVASSEIYIYGLDLYGVVHLLRYAADYEIL